MNIEKWTERVRGSIQSAQSLAVCEGHQQFLPLHILKCCFTTARIPDRPHARRNSGAVLKATRSRSLSATNCMMRGLCFG